MTQQQSSTDVYVSYGSLGASANYVEVDQANGNAAQQQKNHGGGYSFTYDIGNFGIGYGKTYQNPAIAAAQVQLLQLSTMKLLWFL